MWGDPKTLLEFGMWDCRHLTWSLYSACRDCLGFVWGWNMDTASIRFGVVIWGPSHHRRDQDMGDCLHADGSGDMDSRLELRNRRWGPSHHPCGQDAGTLVLGLGPFYWGRDLGTSALTPGRGELRAGTAAPPQGSAGWKQGTMGAGCVCPLPPHRDSDQGPDPGFPCLLQYHHPEGLRITQMWHRSCLTPF